MTEWTPEALKAEIDYRREHVVRDYRRANRQPSWWYRVTHRIPESRKEDRDAA
jgi:hypothetical protein